MRPRQGPCGQFHLDQRPQSSKLLNPVIGQSRGLEPPAHRNAQSPLCRQPLQRLAHRGHRDSEFLGHAPQGYRLPRAHFAVHDPHAQCAVKLVMCGQIAVLQFFCHMHL